MKVWLLTNTPSPYQVELLSAIQRDGRCDLDVRFMRQTHRGQAWQPGAGQSFRFKAMAGIGPSLWADAFRLHPRAVVDCLVGRHDLFVLSGQYTSLTFVLCSILLRLRRKRWVMWLEQPWPEDYRPAWTKSVSAKSGLARTLRKRALACLLRNASGVFCIGTAAVDAYTKLGADPAKLAAIPYCCDTSRFETADPAAVEAIRKIWSLGGKTVFLFSGQLIERKGVDVLIRAFSRIAGSDQPAALVILGDGPLRASLESSVPQAARELVHFAGHLDQKELPPYFHASHVFVLPTRHDGWGVVINEACAAGLPVISTSAAGAARDLVADGRNGFIVPRDDEDRLAEAMRFFLMRPDQIPIFGVRAKEAVAAFSVESGARAFCDSAMAAAARMNS